MDSANQWFYNTQKQLLEIIPAYHKWASGDMSFINFTELLNVPEPNPYKECTPVVDHLIIPEMPYLQAADFMKMRGYRFDKEEMFCRHIYLEHLHMEINKNIMYIQHVLENFKRSLLNPEVSYIMSCCACKNEFYLTEDMDFETTNIEDLDIFLASEYHEDLYDTWGMGKQSNGHELIQYYYRHRDYLWHKTDFDIIEKRRTLGREHYKVEIYSNVAKHREVFEI